MFGNQRRWPAAAMAGGFAAFVALAGCGGDRSVASKSAAAFQEAQKKGETFEGAGHSHGHGAVTPGGPGGGHAEADAGAGAANHANHEEAPPGHAHGKAASPDHSAMGHASQAHAGGHASQPDRSAAQQSDGHAGHAGMDHGQSHQGHAEPGGTAGQDEHAGHAGHPQAPPAGGQASSGGHAGHSPAQESMAPGTAVAAPEAVSPGQPAATLRPGPLDAPAPTSVADAQRSAEMAEEMRGASSGGHGGHGGHGAGTYRQVDAGRGPEAHQAPREQTPGGGSHDHGAHAMAEEAAEVYVCPMHPEVTSTAPGKCPKCGMDLVKRRKE